MPGLKDSGIHAGRLLRGFLYCVFFVLVVHFGHLGVAQQVQPLVKPIPGTENLMEEPSAFWKFFEVQQKVFHEKNGIDSIVFKDNRNMEMEPAPLASDSVFIRRIYYDLTGSPPSFLNAYRFLRDGSADKREKLIEELLDSNEFFDFHAAQWCDLLRVKSEFPINLWPNGAMVYYRWLRDAVRTNMSYDTFARQLLLSDGSDFRDAPSNFYRAVNPKTPEGRAEAISRLFLGMRISSLEQSRRKSLVTFFSRVATKKTAEWKEEIVYWDRTPLEEKNLYLPDGKKVTIADDQDPREVFADWLIRPDNHIFNQVIVNRIWCWLLGRGIVHEPDDFRKDNPAVHEDLLIFLERELVASHYDMKHIYRLILNSHVYQQSSIARKDYAKEEKYFATYPIRRHNAETLQDTFIKVFNVKVTYKSEVPEPYTYVPSQIKTVQIADSGITNSFLETFGRANRDSGLLADRNNKTSQSQQLFFLNSTEMNNWTKDLITQINQFIPKDSKDRASKQDELMNIVWMTLLSRTPTQVERIVMRQTFGSSKDWTQNDIHDMIWAIVNTKEFLCQH